MKGRFAQADVFGAFEKIILGVFYDYLDGKPCRDIMAENGHDMIAGELGLHFNLTAKASF